MNQLFLWKWPILNNILIVGSFQHMPVAAVDAKTLMGRYALQSISLHLYDGVVLTACPLHRCRYIGAVVTATPEKEILTCYRQKMKR
jgi:hypothetical protein